MHLTGIANANGNEEADACVIQGNIIFIIKGGLRQVIKKFFLIASFEFHALTLHSCDTCESQNNQIDQNFRNIFVIFYAK